MFTRDWKEACKNMKQTDLSNDDKITSLLIFAKKQIFELLSFQNISKVR